MVFPAQQPSLLPRSLERDIGVVRPKAIILGFHTFTVVKMHLPPPDSFMSPAPLLRIAPLDSNSVTDSRES